MSTKKGKDDKSKGEDQDTPNNKGKGGAADKKPPKSLYERLVGKSAVTNETKRGSVKTALLNWFAKESAEERAFRSTLKNYRGKLTLELQQITKAVNRHQRRYQEQRHEFDKQEKQLIAWGLKGAIQKFHMQAWFRLERCKLQEKITSEIEKIVSQRQSRSIEYLQHFEETAQKKDKFSLREAEEFCQTPESLIMLDSVVLHLHERLKKLDLLCTYATRQFLLLEPEFAWKDTKKRSKILYTILMNYNNLPQVNHLDNIETDLSWEQFCMWCAVRAHKLKQIEQEYSDFIEDQRELEGRLFFRWHSSVMLTIKSPDQAPPLSNATRESTDGLAGNGATDPEHLKSRPTALKVTPGSIKAFIRYFATEIIGVKYEIPKECLQASIALTESLFFRRLSPYIFRYIDKLQREKDDYWRLHAQKCRYISPAVYSVPDKYFKGKSSNQNKESSKDATTPPTLHPQLLQHHGDVYRASSVAEQERMRLSVEFPTFSSFQMAQQKGGVSSSPKKNPPVTNNTNAPTNNNNAVTHTPFHPSAASFIVSPPSRDTETQANNTATVSTAPPSAPSNITETPESSHRKEGENRPTPAVLFTPEASNASIHPQKNETNADVQYLERLSYDEQELQFPIEVANNEKGNTENQHEIDTSDEDVEKVKSKRAEIENIRVKSKSEAAMLESHPSFAPESYNERVETGDILATINSVTASTTPTAATSIPTSSLDSVERKDSPPPSIVPPVIANSVTTPSNPSTTLIAPVPISNSQNKGNGNGNGGGKGPSRQNSPGLPSKPSNSNGGQASPLKRVHVNYCTCHYCQTFSLSLRLQRFPKYEPGMEDGLPYARSSRVLSWMNLAVYPREMIFYLSLACKWILRDAIDVSGSRSVIGADTMVPLFTMVLIHARIPNIHLLLYILMQYGEYDEQGDISYNIANLEGSMQFIMQMEISNEIEEAFQLTALCDSILSSIKTNGNNRKGSTAAMVMASSSHENTHIHDNAVMMASSSPSSFNEHALKASFASVMSNATGGPPQLSQEEMKALDMKAMQELGEWLRDQQTMEETIAILQNDGWML